MSLSTVHLTSGECNKIFINRFFVGRSLMVHIHRPLLQTKSFETHVFWIRIIYPDFENIDASTVLDLLPRV